MDFKYGALGLAGILLLLYFQTFEWLLESWQYDPFYSHGFLVPVISLVIIWSKRGELKNITPKRDPPGIYFFTLGLILYTAGFLWKSFFLSGVSLIPLIIGLMLHFYGRELMNKILFPVCFLIFMIPLPGLYEVSFYLQHFTAGSAAVISQALGAGVYSNGLEMQVAGCQIFIGIPCSGLRSIISLMMVACVFVYIIRGSLQRKAVILFSALPIAIISNTIRVTSAILIADYFGCDAATTFFHDFSSIFLFVISIIMLIIISKILKCDILSRNTEH